MKWSDYSMPDGAGLAGPRAMPRRVILVYPSVLVIFSRRLSILGTACVEREHAQSIRTLTAKTREQSRVLREEARRLRELRARPSQSPD